MRQEVTVLQPRQPEHSPLDILEAALTLAREGQVDLPITTQDAIEKLIATTKAKSTAEKQTEQVISDLFKDFDFMYIESLQNSPQMSVWFRQAALDKPYKPFKENSALGVINHYLKKRHFGLSAKKAKNIYDTLKIEKIKSG